MSATSKQAAPLAAVFPQAPVWPAVIGMVHLPPLAGSPGYDGAGYDGAGYDGAGRSALLDRALVDAERLQQGGVDGLLIENFGDAPFFPGDVPPETVAQMAVVTAAVRQRTDLPIGVNVLRNDGASALAVAAAAGAQFIRVNVLAGARVTDQGLIQGQAHALLRKRRLLGAEAIRIFADVDVKHSAPLAVRPLEEETRDLIERAGADGLIVSGAATGRPTDLDHLARVAAVAAGRWPVLVGSGVTLQTAAALRSLASGLIVGTEFKQNGDVRLPVDADRVRRLIETVRG